jgi:ParB family transcriptional regulator, chromosome partitioning protein
VAAVSHVLPSTARTADRSFLVAVGRLRPSPRRARLSFDEHALVELAHSLCQWGQLQPVVVRRVDASGDYELVCGERRWLAHQRAGLDMLWAVEWEATDQEALVLSLIENLQRVNLSHAEKVAALDQLAELSNAHGLRRTARQLRVDPSWLSRQLAVRRDPQIFRAFEAGLIGVGQAAELLRAPADMRDFLLHRVTRSTEHVSVATVRAWVDEARAGAPKCPDDSSLRGARPSRRRYRELLDEFKQLAPPVTADDRAAIRELLQVIHDVLRRSVGTLERVPGAAVTDWVELYCLMCGEHARAQQLGNRLKLTDQSNIRTSSGRLVCGRCGGSVAPGDRGRQYHY